MKLVVNGEPQEIPAATLAEAVQSLDLGEAKVATALNGEFVPARARAGPRSRTATGSRSSRRGKGGWIGWSIAAHVGHRTGEVHDPQPRLHPLRRELRLAAHAGHVAISLARDPRRGRARVGRRNPHRVAQARVGAAEGGAGFLAADPRHRRTRAAQHRRLLQRERGGDDGCRWRAKSSARPGSSSR